MFGAVAGVAIGTSGTRPSGAGPSSPRRCRGAATSSSRARSWRSPAAWSAACSAPCSPSGLRRRLPRPAVARTVLVGSLVVCWPPPSPTACWPPCPTTSRPRSGSRTSRTTRGRRTSPSSWTRPTSLDDPSWVQITSWQGDGLVVDALERTGEGAYRTTEPVPLHGTWKALLRIHDGRMLTAVPIYLPADEAISAEDEIPAEDGMTRAAIPEIEILQRELKDSGGGLWADGQPRRPGLHAGADRGDLLGRRPVLPPGQCPGARTPTPRPTRRPTTTSPGPAAALERRPLDPGDPPVSRSSCPAARCPARAARRRPRRLRRDRRPPERRAAADVRPRRAPPPSSRRGRGDAGGAADRGDRRRRAGQRGHRPGAGRRGRAR